MSNRHSNSAPLIGAIIGDPVGKSKPKLINREILHLLGYRATSDGFENKKRQMQILRLERTDNGTTPDFCYCSHMDEDIGFILANPFRFYADRLPTRRIKDAVR